MILQNQTKNSNNRFNRDYKIICINIPGGGCMYYVYHFRIGFSGIFKTINNIRNLLGYYYDRKYY